MRDTATALPRLAVALTHHDGRPSGALYVLFAEGRRAIGRAEFGVLELLAEAAGAAATNARVYDRTRRQREHERAVVDATLDGMAVLDPRGLVRQWNPAAHELTGHRPRPMPSVGNCLSRGPTQERSPSTSCRRAGGWRSCVRRSATPVRLVVDFRDITRTKTIEQSKDLFLAVTSHELRTPITVVQGYASTLLTHWDDLPDDERKESVHRIAERTRALAALVEQLLLGSRAGLAPAQPAVPFDLVGLLRSAVAGFTAMASGHTFVVDVPPDLPDALGDPSSTEIVFGQLLENAVKYSPDGGEITLTARAEGDRVVALVCDRGLGIPGGEHAQVFERFYQVGGERRRFGGVGLGLYIVRRLLETQGASVQALPRDGGGTCFSVSFPAANVWPS